MKIQSIVLILFFGLNLWAQNEDLGIAVDMDDVAKVSKMINSGRASVNEKVGANNHPIILLAAKSGSEKVAKFLISRNADVNAQNSARETALMQAVFFLDSQADNTFVIHDRIAVALVEAGAKTENGDWWAPMAYAAFAGRLGIAQYQMAHGALVDGPVVDNISTVNTPLMMACMQGHEKFVRYLLLQGADAKLKNKTGATASSLAEKYNNTNLLKYLNCAMNLAPGEAYKGKCE